MDPKKSTGIDRDSLLVPIEQTAWRSWNRRHWLGWFTVAIVIAGISVLARIIWPGTLIANASVPAWGIFIVAAIGLWMGVCAVVWFTITIAIKLDKSQRRRLVFTALYTSIAYFIWSVLVIIVFEAVFGVNPFPARRSDGSERTLDRDATFWIPRLFIVNIFLAILLILRAMALVRLRFGNRMLQYAHQVQQVLEEQEVLEHLTEDMQMAEIFDPQPRPKLTEQPAITEYDAAIKLQGMFRGFLRRKKRKPETTDASVNNSTSLGQSRGWGGRRTSAQAAAPLSTIQSGNTPEATPVPAPVPTSKPARDQSPARTPKELLKETAVDTAGEKGPTPVRRASSRRTTSVIERPAPVNLRDDDGGYLDSVTSRNEESTEVSESSHKHKAKRKRHKTKHKRNKSDTRSQEEPHMSDSNERASNPSRRINRHKSRVSKSNAHRVKGEADKAIQDLIEANDSEMTAAMLVGFETVRYTYLTTCHGRLAIKNRKLAMKTAEALFYRHEVGDHVAITALASPYVSSPDMRRRILEMFDPHDKQNLALSDLEEAMSRVYHKRKHLALSLKDLDSIVQALGSFLTAAVIIITLFLVNIVFSTGDYAEVTVTVGTTLFALSFIFAESAKNVRIHRLDPSCLPFFSERALKSHDRSWLALAVSFSSSTRSFSSFHVPGWDPMYVISMSLSQTVFRVWDGRVVTIANHSLYPKELTNIRRAGPMTEATFIQVSVDTPWWKLEELEKRYRAFLRTKSADFDETASSFFVRDIDVGDGNALKVGFIVAQTTNFQNGEHVPRKHMLIREIVSSCNDLEITYWRPRQRGAIIEGPSDVMGYSQMPRPQPTEDGKGTTTTSATVRTRPTSPSPSERAAGRLSAFATPRSDVAPEVRPKSSLATTVTAEAGAPNQVAPPTIPVSQTQSLPVLHHLTGHTPAGASTTTDPAVPSDATAGQAAVPTRGPPQELAREPVKK
ncbi:uncharacterized protein MONBRDRAFT_38083 [Monosiga brevicollis MX1]|uniref:Uncharacterized protein n=1 Tax=Monosiga brevicollis TaxID=81824 RepID=A9V5K3_MONBE|nr:uncharacterized protein MONBRDRAFT_38083 [Monosiga brevicollis MX1]EDQ87134.1 predicted protein [Monosiga brevicollis MX1]|eukprot:XP_001748077.1 hypothetical protein [Monosiga brevicollis MX1]